MIKTLGEMLAARTGNITILEQVQLWLSQTDVQELLAAAWDPALAITHHDMGVITNSYEDPDTGEYQSFQSHDYAVECTVRGEVYGVGLACRPEEVLEDRHWLLAEMALRDRLVDAALVGVR